MTPIDPPQIPWDHYTCTGTDIQYVAVILDVQEIGYVLDLFHIMYRYLIPCVGPFIEELCLFGILLPFGEEVIRLER